MALMLACANTVFANKKDEASSESAPLPKVLVVAPDNNVNSDYYVPEMLTEGTGIGKDSISYTYNNVIAAALQKAASKEKIVVVNGCSKLPASIAKGIRLSGDGENATVDLSMVNKGQLGQEMRQLGASYLLVIDQHFLKYQEVPFRTMFHFVNYSVYDSNERKLGQGKSYFTSFEPQSAKDMAKSSQKSSKKMVEDISKMINM